jgi:hypothetical protein
LPVGTGSAELTVVPSDRPRFISPVTLFAVVATTLPGLFQALIGVQKLP